MSGLQLQREPDELRRMFETLVDLRSVARMLEVRPETLGYYIHRAGYNRYRQFTLAKKGGGTRTIYNPMSGLKIIQHKLATVLSLIYRPRAAVQGFTTERSIATNAQLHENATYILNVDLVDFFPSINFGRVRGLFIAKPFDLLPGAATVLAQICCHDNHIPQGAPTSPIISNMVAATLDTHLQRLARRNRCLYSRYADDITISTKRPRFPRSLAREVGPSGTRLELGKALVDAIESNGFNINHDKVRLRDRNQRQEVTGLVVNQEANVPRKLVRQVRAMLHAWRKHGYRNAADEFHHRYDRRKNRSPVKPLPEFHRVVKGKIDFIGMVKGKDDPVYEKLLAKYASLKTGFAWRPHAKERPNHLKRFKDGLWVLETDDGEFQGTAFHLADVGVVTCAHVLGGNTKAFRPERPNVKYDVRAVISDVTLDVAIIEIVGATGYEFVSRDHGEAKQGDTVVVAGFPNWAPGATLWEARGTVAGYHTYFGIRCYRVTCPIVTGASGAPVFDGYRRVIGVAARGASSVRASSATVDFAVIPIGRAIEMLNTLRGGNGSGN